MSRPWMRSMPNHPEENYGTPQNHNFTQGQTSQQGSETAFTQVCRLYEQSQQQHQEMMNQFINMGSNRGQYQPQSKLSELQKTRPPTFSHTDKPLEADDWLRDMERKLIIAQCSDHEKYCMHHIISQVQLHRGGKTSCTCTPTKMKSPGKISKKVFVGHIFLRAS